jgi:hypothetical protein
VWRHHSHSLSLSCHNVNHSLSLSCHNVNHSLSLSCHNVNHSDRVIELGHNESSRRWSCPRKDF